MAEILISVWWLNSPCSVSTSYTGGLQIGTFGTFNMAAISLFLHRLSHFFFNSFEISWSSWLLTRKYRKKIIVQTKWEVRCDIMKYHNFLAAVSISQWGILYKPAAGNVKNYLIIKNIRKMGLLIGERLLWAIRNDTGTVCSWWVYLAFGQLLI